MNRSSIDINRSSVDINHSSVNINRSSADLKHAALTVEQSWQVAILEYDNKLLYATGMQSLQDLTYGSTSRASAVATSYAGVNIEIIARTDGNFDFTVQGHIQAVYTLNQLTDKIRSAFDEAYRDSK